MTKLSWYIDTSMRHLLPEPMGCPGNEYLGELTGMTSVLGLATFDMHIILPSVAAKDDIQCELQHLSFV